MLDLSGTVDRIVSNILITVESTNDFNNYRTTELGLGPMLIQVLENTGIKFKE
jgi:hypothetical protein